MTIADGDASLLILLAVLLPPRSLDVLGPVVEERTVNTDYGTVGPVALRAPDAGPRVWILPYTGLPTRTDPRATVVAARQLGVRRILNWDMAIGVNHMLQRGQPVIAGDFIDWTRHQPDTLLTTTRRPFGYDDTSRPPGFCTDMRRALAAHLPAPEGVYLGVDGPRRETPSEARLFRRWGVDLIGQNLVPEVALAHDAGLCYAGLATVHHYSSDQSTPVREGEVRAGLELVLETLPSLAQTLSTLDPCTCRAAG